MHSEYSEYSEYSENSELLLMHAVCVRRADRFKACDGIHPSSIIILNVLNVADWRPQDTSVRVYDCIRLTSYASGIIYILQRCRDAEAEETGESKPTDAQQSSITRCLTKGPVGDAGDACIFHLHRNCSNLWWSLLLHFSWFRDAAVTKVEYLCELYPISLLAF